MTKPNMNQRPKPMVELSDEQIAKIVLEACAKIDARWKDGESTASLVYPVVRERLRKHQEEIADPLAWVGAASRREAFSFHCRIAERRRCETPFDQDKLTIEHRNSRMSSIVQRVSAIHRERFEAETGDWDQDADRQRQRGILQRVLKRLSCEDRQLILAKFGNGPSLADLARRSGHRRQNESKKANLRFEKLRSLALKEFANGH